MAQKRLETFKIIIPDQHLLKFPVKSWQISFLNFFYLNLSIYIYIKRSVTRQSFHGIWFFFLLWHSGFFSLCEKSMKLPNP